MLHVSRTVPTVIVSAQKFCTSCNAWFTHHTRARVDIEAISCATKWATEMKFSFCDQIKFNEPAPKPLTPEMLQFAKHLLSTASS